MIKLLIMKTNFKKSKTVNYKNFEGYEEVSKEEAGLSKKEFEDFVVKSGAKGSFMVYRSTKKEDELGIDEL